MQLTSTQNSFLKDVRRAASAGRTTEEGLVVAEGPHLLSEALHGLWRIRRVLTTAVGRNRYASLLRELDAEVLDIPSRVFASISATETAQEVLALLKPKQWSWIDLLHSSAPIVTLDGIQDPGNAGTIIRSAEAFGAAGIVFLRGCVRVANGKLLRATAGSIFRVPFLEGIPPASLMQQIRSAGLVLYALQPAAALSLPDADLRANCALVVGSEAAGVSPQLLSEAQAISVPTRKVESLNAAVACSIALFEAQQQRSRS